MLTGNILTYKTNMSHNTRLYKSKIIGIEGELANEKNIIGLLNRFNQKKQLNIIYKNDNGIYNDIIVKKGKNKNYLWFLLFILLYANIHYIWGFVIWIDHSGKFQSKILFIFSFILSFYYFAMFNLFTSRDFQILFYIMVLLMGLFLIYLGYGFSNKKATVPLFVIFVILVIYSLKNHETSQTLLFEKLSFLFLMLCSSFSMGKIILHTINNNRFVVRRNLLIISAFFPGLLIPVSYFFLSHHIDMTFPVSITTGLTLIIPLFFGNGLHPYNFMNPKIFGIKGFLTLFIIILTAMIGASILSYMTESLNLVHNVIIYSTIVAGFLFFIFNFIQYLNIKTNTFFIKKDYPFANSIQNIAEIVSSPGNLSSNIEKIFSGMSKLTDVTFFKVLLIDDSFKKYKDNLNKYVEYLSKDSDIIKYLKKNRNGIFRYLLFKNSFIEEKIYQFLKRLDIVLLIPIHKGNKIKGALLVGEKNSDVLFNVNEISYLEKVGSQIYQLLENYILFQDYIKRKNYERELDVASYIQLRLLPQRSPGGRGIDISFYNRPYLKITGDYFDFITINESHTAIIIGDISGHGLAAGMLLSMTASIANTMLLEQRTIEKTVNEINNFLTNKYKGTELITLFIGDYNKKTRELKYINAGHCSPIYIKNKNELSFLENRSLLLGVESNTDYNSTTLSLNKGDELIFYTDGLIEMYNTKTGEEHCEIEILDIITQTMDNNVDEKIDELISYINKHRNEAIKDDITIIALEIL